MIFSRVFFLAFVLLTLTIMLACGGGGFNPPVAKVTDVYTAGFEENDSGMEIAKYWKNGEPHVLGAGVNGSYATSIAVSGKDVYVAGIEGNGVQDIAKYWKNGVAVELTNGTTRGFANSIYASGSDVYVAGGEQPANTHVFAEYWKNGVPVVLPDLGQGAMATSVFVSGGDVYVAGWEGIRTQIDPTHILVTDVAAYWKNGARVELTDGTALAVAYSIFVSGADIYVGGYACHSTAPSCAQATYWKNGMPVQLSDETSTTVSSIFVSGGDVYTAGTQSDSFAEAWKNATSVPLLKADNRSGGNGISVAGGDVYIGGAFSDDSGQIVAGYWKNGTPVSVTTGDHLASAFALTTNTH